MATMSPTITAAPVARQAVCAAVPRVHAHATRNLAGSSNTARRSGMAIAARTAAAQRRVTVPAFAVQAAVATQAQTARVTFQTVHRLPFGQVLKLVGTGRELGDWDVSKAPAMTWAEGDRWSITLALPAGKREFKVAVAEGNGTSLLGYEDGPNRTLQVPEADAQANKAFTVNCEWGSVASWLETLLPEDARKQHTNSTIGHSEWSHTNGHNQHSQHNHSLHNGNHNQHNHSGGAQTVEALQWEVLELRRQLASRGEEAAAFSRACDELRGERDHLSHQLQLVQQQLAASNEEKAHLAAAAAKSEKNIQLLRQVGQLLSTMHD